MKDQLQNKGHYLTCGDSTNGRSYKDIMGIEKANLLLADPPYCLLERRNKKTGQLRDPKRVKINHEAVTRYPNVKTYKIFTKSWMEKALPFLEENATLCIWTNFLGKGPIIEVATELGFTHFQGEYLWAKLTKEGSGNEMLARLYEVALIFRKVPMKSEQDIHSPPLVKSIITHYDEEKEAESWGLHPNHKPFSCIEPLIRQYSLPEDRILDPFTGSGSTPAAAIKLGRKISGIEILPDYAEITLKRSIFQLEKFKAKN